MTTQDNTKQARSIAWRIVRCAQRTQDPARLLRLIDLTRSEALQRLALCTRGDDSAAGAWFRFARASVKRRAYDLGFMLRTVHWAYERIDTWPIGRAAPVPMPPSGTVTASSESRSRTRDDAFRTRVREHLAACAVLDTVTPHQIARAAVNRQARSVTS